MFWCRWTGIEQGNQENLTFGRKYLVWVGLGGLEVDPFDQVDKILI